MKFNPKFKIGDIQNKEEKLISEYIRNLHEVSKAHINLNKASFNDNEIFNTLIDGAIGFAGTQIQALVKVMADKSQIPFFIEEAERLFKCYLIEALK